MADKFDIVAEWLMNGDHYLPTPAGTMTKQALANYLRRELAGAVPDQKVVEPSIAANSPVHVIATPSLVAGDNYWVGAVLEPGGPVIASVNAYNLHDAVEKAKSPRCLEEIKRRHASRRTRGKTDHGLADAWLERQREKLDAPPKPVDPEEQAAKGGIAGDAARQINR
jgi:hypothetical protein